MRKKQKTKSPVSGKQSRKSAGVGHSFWKTNENLCALIQSSPLAIVVIDTHGVVRMWSPAAESIFGWSSDEVIGQPIPTIPDEEQDAFRKQLKQGCKGKVYTNLHQRRKRKDGKIIDVSISSSIIRDNKNAVVGFMGIMDDISDRKKTEAALLESEERFRRMAENAPDVIARWSPQTGVEYINSAIEMIAGYTPEEIIGNMGFLVSKIHPEDADKFVHEIQSIGTKQRKRKDASSTPMEMRFMAKDGGLLWFETLFVPQWDKAGNISFIECIIRDVTERKKAESILRKQEEEYRFVVDTMAEGLAFLDAHGAFSYANDAFCRMLKYAADEMMGHSPADFLDKESREAFRENLKKRKKGESTTYELTFTRKDGEKVFTQVSGKPILNERREFKGAFALIMDITERKHREEKLTKLALEQHMLLDHARDFVYRHDTQGVFTYMSPSVEQITGYTEEEWLKHYTTYMTDHPLNKKVIEYTETTLKTGKQSPPYLVEVYHKDGHKIMLEVNEKPYFENGKVAGIIGVARDVTARVCAEVQLRDSEEKWRSLMENSPDIIIMLGLDGTILFINRVLPGFERQNVIGRNMLDFIPPDNHEFVSGILKSSIQTGETTSHEILGTGAHGAAAWYSVRVGPILRDRKVAALTMVCTDITEHKQAEKALMESEALHRLLVDTMTEGLGMLDEKGLLTYVNDRLCEMWGYSRGEIIGKSPVQLVDGKDRKLVEEHLKRRKKGEHTTYELTWKRKDGKGVTTIVSGKPILDADGKVKGAFAVMTDITERKQAEDALKKTHEELELRVKERTAEISMANAVLTRQIAERHKAEQEIQRVKAYQDGILENSLDVIITLKKDDTFSYLNPRVEEIIGYRREELYGKPFMHFIPEHRKEFMQKKLEEMNEGFSGRYITEVIRADGSTMHCFVSQSPMEGFDEFLVALQDITENVKAEEALRESEQRLRAIIDTEPACVKIVREDGTLLEMNASGLAILEAEFPDDVIGKCIYSCVSPEYRESFRMLNESVCRGNSGSLEFEIISLRGNARWMETHMVPIHYGNGGGSGKCASLAITYDITERRKAENAVRESESRYRALAETNPVGIWQITEEGYTIYINPTMCALIEIDSPRELEGKTYHEFFTPESHKKIETEQMSRHKGIATSYEVEIIGKHGRKRNVVISGAPVFSADGQFHSRMGTFIDITERKQQEEKYRMLIDNVSEIIYVIAFETDPFAGCVTFVSHQAENIIGYTSEEFLTDDGLWFRLLHPDDIQRVTESTQKIVDTKKSHVREYRLRHKITGEYHWLEDKVVPRFDSEGKVNGFFGVARDVTKRKQAEEALKQNEEQYRLLFESNPHPMWIFDLETLSFLGVNDAALHHYGYAEKEFLSMTVKDIRPKEDVPILLEHLEKNVLPGIDFEGTRRHVKKDGTVMDVEITSHEIMFAGKRAKMVMAIDVTERKHVQETLQDNEARLRVLTEKMPAVLWTTDAGLKFTSSLGAGLAGLQSQPGETVGMTLYEYFQTDDFSFIPVAAHLRALEGEPVSYDLQWMGRVFNSHVEPLRDTDGRIVGCIGIALDVTERRQAEETVQHQAYHDALTGLPNKMLFNERLTIDVSHAHRRREMLAIMFLDLDRFKTINDTLGHAVGDQLLQGVAGRLISHLPEDYTIARLGGDEFLILVPEVTQVDDVARMAKKVLDAFKHPWTINGHELYVTTSIGVAFYPDDGDDVETLVRNADTAMYRAKEQGRNNYQLYAPAMNVKAFEQLVMENSLRRALDRKEFVVYYQPQVDIHTGKIVGMEALIRWQHPDLGLIFPSNFIPLAEETGLIVPIGEWVLRTACAQNKIWQKAGYSHLRVSVNLALRQFQQKDFVDTVSQTLDETKLDPQYLDLEITESIAMEHADSTFAVLRELNKRGVQISIDDFGTGYSSLSYLKKFPIHTLKIDQSFVRDITTDPNDAAIASAIIVLGHSLKLKVVAEGVETKEQLAFLRQQKCDEIQGFLFSHPIPSGDFEKLLAKGNITPPETKK